MSIYRVTTEHGVSQKMIGETAMSIRKDFNKAMPGVKIESIKLIKAFKIFK